MTSQEVLAQFTLRNVLDVALVAFLFYQIISMLKGTRAAQVLIGLLVIFIAYALSGVFEFETLYWLIGKFYASFIIVVIVLFQDDMRRFLTRFGRGPFVTGLDEGSGLGVIEEVISAARNLSHERLGALMVFERGIGLDKLYDHAVKLEALVSEQLLLSIFQSFSPLHDGAVIVQKNRITCASAHLPLSKTPEHGRKLGTRHSAAVGISEQTDAVVLVVSEETGAISLAVNGELHRQHSPEAARRRLMQLLLPQHKTSPFGGFVQNRLFFGFNVLILKIRRVFSLGVPYTGQERRRHAFDRRFMSANPLAQSEGATDIAHENRLASNEVRMHLRFPGSISQVRAFQSLGGRITLTNQPLAHDTGLPATVVSSDDPDAGRNEGEFGGQVGDGGTSVSEVAFSGLEQNEAVVALNQLGPEDRLVPPELPLLPPRDVSIGGVSINPPIESQSLNDESEETEEGNRGVGKP